MIQFGSEAAKDLLVNETHAKIFEKSLHSKCECCMSKWKKLSNARNILFSNRHKTRLFKGKNANDSKHAKKFLLLPNENQLLRNEEKVNTEMISLSGTILDTLWKLYRDPGETIEELRDRLVNNLNVEKITDSKISEISVNKVNENYNEDCNEDNEELGEKSKRIITNSFDIGDILTVEIIELNESVQLSNDQESFNIKEECKKNKTFNTTSQYSYNNDSFKSSLNCSLSIPRIERTISVNEITNSLFSFRQNRKLVDLHTEINKETLDKIEGTSMISDISSDDEIEFAFTKKDEIMSSIITKNRHNNKRKKLNYEYDADFTYSTFQLSDSSDTNIPDSKWTKAV